MKIKTETLDDWEYLAIERALENMLKRGEAEHTPLVALCRKVRAGDKFKLTTAVPCVMRHVIGRE